MFFRRARWITAQSQEVHLIEYRSWKCIQFLEKSQQANNINLSVNCVIEPSTFFNGIQNFLIKKPQLLVCKTCFDILMSSSVVNAILTVVHLNLYEITLQITSYCLRYNWILNTKKRDIARPRWGKKEKRKIMIRIRKIIMMTESKGKRQL